jgi:autotransporter family porin
MQAWSVRRMRLFSRGTEHGCLHPFAAMSPIWISLEAFISCGRRPVSVHSHRPSRPGWRARGKTGVNMDTKVWSRLGARSTTRSARWASLVFVGVLALALVPRSALAATINVACGDVPGLKAAITSSSPGDTISLAAGCTYTLTTVDNVDGAFGPNGLPLINKVLTIEGNGSTIANAGVVQFRFFDLGAAANVTLNQVTLSAGTLGNQGGAILLKTGAQLTTTGVKFSGNVATAGGGAIYAQAGTTLRVTEDTFSNNDSGGTAGGGGILSQGTTAVERSTFTGNSGDLGGGIMVGLTGSLSVVNSTFTANTAASFGNAIKNFGTATVVNSTVSDNPSSTSDGSISSTGTMLLQNTIVADGTPSNCSTVGPITDGGHNISWPDTTCPGLNVDPNLGPLANNGGPTQTMALPLGSPAVDGVPATGAGCPPTDQRGVLRPQGPSCDVGAFELQVAPTPTPVPPTPTAAPVPGPPSTGRLQTSDVARWFAVAAGAGTAGGLILLMLGVRVRRQPL